MANSRYPEEYIEYLAEYFGSRDFFECHEIMEEYWKKTPDSEWSVCWLVLIRLAVVQYHARRGNGAGAAKLLAKASGEVRPDLMDRLGLDGAELERMIKDKLTAWSGGDATYEEFELPIADPELLRLVRTRCEEKGWGWATPRQRVPDDIVHRHLRRDRSEVVSARAAAAELKAAKREKGE
ncbi:MULTISPECIES: DUF309 domain-containing protein [Cohnella]|uniref:DUF309 domain-containing protein n=1 Tax=Cohnella TaxID=329857 RepID=UPI0009BC1134|nr:MULTISPECIES: DUF309 domain-containing protein [Cohnella]MBN2983943.1 DUF309 domain-containing protein [Cohnella algarum]